MGTLLECKDLTKSFSGKTAIDHIDLSIESGHIIGLLGPNGSGKTTLIKMINGLLTPTSGTLYYKENPIGVESKRHISYLPDHSYLNMNQRVKEIIAFFQDFYEDFDSERAYDMLQKLNINPNDSLKSMSKGTKEKVQLILVMSRKAELYILDEPIAGVDPAARDYILDVILTNYDPSASILISTHLIADIENILDQVIFIQNGQIRLSSSVDDIRAEEGKSVDADEPVDITCNDSSITLVKKENDQWTVSLPNKTKTYLFTARYNGNANYAGSKAACQVTVKEKKSQTGGGTLIPPEKPTPEEPTPEKPAPEEPTPEKPAPEKPTPEKPAPEKPNPGETEVVPNVTPVPELESKTDKTIKNKTVTIKCKSRKGKKQVLKLDKSTINYLIKKEAKALQLEFGNVAVIMDRNALKEIKKQMNSDVYFHVKKLDKRILSSKAGKIVKKRPMYEISVTGAKKKTLGKLKKGKVTVKIHYKISKKEKKKDLFAYTINKKGNVKKISKSYYDSKKQTVNFTTKSFSKFAVGGRL